MPAIMVVPKRKCLKSQQETIEQEPLLPADSLVITPKLIDDLANGIYAKVLAAATQSGYLLLDETINGTYAKVKATSLSEAGLILLDQVVDGTTYKRVKSVAINADGMVILDQTVQGTYGLILSTDISAGHIKLDTVVAGTYGLVKSTDISSGHILLSTVIQSSSYRTVADGDKSYWNGKPDDMDDIANGSTYGKVRTTEISSGYLKLTSNTVKSGKWYDESGVEIDATAGINILGTHITFKSPNGSSAGWILGDTDIHLAIQAEYSLLLEFVDEMVISSSHPTRPDFANQMYLGTSSYYLNRVYANTYYGKNTTIQSFQQHDDIEMLRAIKSKNEYLDVETFPSGLLERDEEMEAERQRIIGLIDAMEQNLEIPIGTVKARKQAAEMEMQDGLAFKGINVMNWQSLLMGAILQLADKVDKIEKKIGGKK